MSDLSDLEHMMLDALERLTHPMADEEDLAFAQNVITLARSYL